MANINWTNSSGQSRTYGTMYGSGGGTSSYDGAGVVVKTSRSRSGGKHSLAAYRAYKDSGAIPSNVLTDHWKSCRSPTDMRSRALQGTYYGLDGKPTSAAYFALGPYGLYWDGNPPSLDVSSALVQSLRADATQKAKLRAIDMEINVAQFVAEFGQTRKLVADTAIVIARAMRDVRRGKPLDAVNRLARASNRPKKTKTRKRGDLSPFPNPNDTMKQVVAERWLAIQYGVLPLVSDVYGSVDALVNTLVGRAIRFYVKASSSTSVSSTLSQSTYDYPSPLLGVGTVDTQYQAKAGFLCEVTNTELQTLSKLGLDNPALLAWELVPFSFVVDWFFKVGDMLEASSAFRGVTVRDKWNSLLVTQNGFVNYKPTMQSVNGGTGTTVFSQRYYNRLNYVVDPPFNLQRGSGFNLTRVGNALALLQVTFGLGIPRRTPKAS